MIKTNLGRFEWVIGENVIAVVEKIKFSTQTMGNNHYCISFEWEITSFTSFCTHSDTLLKTMKTKYKHSQLSVKLCPGYFTVLI